MRRLPMLAPLDRVRRLRMREVAGATEVVEIVHAAPVAVHVMHFDPLARIDQRVEQRRHVERVEVVALLQLRERAAQALARLRRAR